MYLSKLKIYLLRYLPPLILISFLVCVHCQKTEEGKYLAIVGEESISATDMDKRMDMLFRDRTSLDDKTIKIVLEDLIERQLILNKARQLGLKVEKEEYNSYIKTLFKDKEPSKYQSELIREDLLIAKVLEKEVASEIATTFVEEKLSVDEENPREYLVFYEITTEDEESINEVYSKIQNGEDLDSLCDEYSCSASSREGGRVGPVEIDTLPDEFKKALRDLTEDELSDVFQSSYGYHIVKVISRLSSEQYIDDYYSIEQMKNSFSNVYNKWIKDLRSNSYVKINEGALNNYIKEYKKSNEKT